MADRRESKPPIYDQNQFIGAYAFYHSGLVSCFGDKTCEEIKRIVRDEAHWYGRKVYGYTGG